MEDVTKAEATVRAQTGLVIQGSPAGDMTAQAQQGFAQAQDAAPVTAPSVPSPQNRDSEAANMLVRAQYVTLATVQSTHDAARARTQLAAGSREELRGARAQQIWAETAQTMQATEDGKRNARQDRAIRWVGMSMSIVLIGVGLYMFLVVMQSASAMNGDSIASIAVAFVGLAGVVLSPVFGRRSKS